MTFFKTDFPQCSILNHLYFLLTFFYLPDPTIEHHIENMMQNVNDRQFSRFLDLHYVLICLKFLSHGLALLEHEPVGCSTVDVLLEGSPGV